MMFYIVRSYLYEDKFQPQTYLKHYVIKPYFVITIPYHQLLFTNNPSCYLACYFYLYSRVSLYDT